MREVQRHNFEFIRTEVLNLSIEEFAYKIGVSKSSYQRMKSKDYSAEYYFSPIQKACKLADIPIDMFATQIFTKEFYEKYKGIHRYQKTPAVVLSKKQLLAFFLFGIIAVCVLLGIVVKHSLYNNQAFSANISSEDKYISEMVYKSNNIYYWTDKEGGSYHLNRNCPTIKNRNNIESGILEEAQKREKFDPCDFCVIK